MLLNFFSKIGRRSVVKHRGGMETQSVRGNVSRSSFSSTRRETKKKRSRDRAMSRKFSRVSSMLVEENV